MDIILLASLPFTVGGIVYTIRTLAKHEQAIQNFTARFDTLEALVRDLDAYIRDNGARFHA